MHTRHRSRPTGTPARASLGALVALLVLAAAEGLAHLLVDPGLYEGDPATLWYLRPDLDRVVSFPPTEGSFRVRTNALGLRGDPPPPEGAWTLALGCSTTFGWGVEAEEAWPARLAALTGEPVVNGGVPGWSTEQARRGAGRWLALRPSRVILAYIVRDAQEAARPDMAVPPTPWIWRTALAGLLRPSGGPREAPRAGRTAHARVPPDRYVDNLRALVEQAGAAEVLLLAFPQPEPPEPWVAAMAWAGPPVLAPRLASDSFFAADPVHLTPTGHLRLAEVVAAASSR